MVRFLCSLWLFMIIFLSSQAQDQWVDKEKSLWHNNRWQGKWISCPNVPQRDYGVFHFRKDFVLPDKPKTYKIHVSADNRYRLFVNGKAVVSGPARGDLHHWYFETVDIASYLQPGKNVVAALVWNMGVYAPIAQISAQTGFVIQGESAHEMAVNTDNSYKVFQSKAYTPCSTDNMERLNAYMVIGPGDDVDASRYIWGWQELDFDDTAWSQAQVVADAVPQGVGTDNIWTLEPRNIPLLEEKPQRLSEIRWVTGMDRKAFSGFLTGATSVTVPANSRVSLLIDQSVNTVAYPELSTSGGKGSSVKLSYAEALFDQNLRKGNRNEVEGKKLIGNYDVFRPDGHAHRLFRPLWLRTYRFIQMDVETGDEPLTLHDFLGYYTTYPFEMNAQFKSNDKRMDDIWDVSWRTARLCAGETYFDCPYYEQLQYSGDTRIQALISLYISGDDRLMRRSLLDFHYSRVPEGMIQGRYPSSRLQIIPTYSLWWISMIHDYWMHRQDDLFIQQFLQGIAGALDWYGQHLDQENGMLGPIPWWPFVDYTPQFSSGLPKGATEGNSSILTLHYAYTLKQAADLFAYFGEPEQAARYRKEADRLNKVTYQHCFDRARGVMADTPEKQVYSQHASILAVLSGSIPEAERYAVIKNVLEDESLIPVTFYFRFYLTRALLESSLGDRYYDKLDAWRKMLDLGLTTFSETPEPTRSDCHAWSASPSYDFLATICGIRPSSPGFKSVLIDPNLGALKEVEASMPHPAGEISVKFKRKGRHGISGTVTLPENLQGNFQWNGKQQILLGGKNTIEMLDGL
ncbi:alpha-L-rhamnosidase C-terminal domain-containing protein [Sphingobacterium gobiense]|uniref:Alpha-L-rhamnosidase n=1 Tax=Sphingobacterium gobiense TaxID=1382456 RepID=A0A2S9JUY3_9SPHI|nr:alpha-L-rhamnosidase C-terminal domain-containing protein [Sphingobacterium gobiense]PRD57096.1 alpha-L-rhamnosidase [Sphingobacterium gobiense]